MAATILPDSASHDWVDLQSHQNLNRCYACNKCTAGCPVAFAMEYGPHRILQMVRFGLKDTALASRDIWLCACCETCSTRCPNDVDIAHMMDALRQMSLAEHARNSASDIADFHRLFLRIARTFGRMHEASLMALLKLRTRDWFSDMGAGIRLAAKGKIPILPERIKGAGEIERMLRIQKAQDSRQSAVGLDHKSQIGNSQ